MNIFERVKGIIDMIFLSKAKEDFNVKPLVSENMEKLIRECADIYAGQPFWLVGNEDIKTVNFCKAICSETARLATLGLGVRFGDSAREKWLQEQIDDIFFNLRQWVEYGCAYGTVILKPNGRTVDVVTPKDFKITQVDNGRVTGAVFEDTQPDRDGKHYFHRLEYHRTLEVGENKRYIITNKCYYSEGESHLGDAIDIKKTPWATLAEEVIVNNLDGNLFAVLKMPHANNVDIDSPLGMPICSDAIEELKDLDIAYSRNALEIIESKRTVIMDSDRLLMGNVKGRPNAYQLNSTKAQMELPDFVKMVEGTGDGDVYHEINPLIQTPVRLQGINALLSQIGYKIGYSNGYFVFNEQTGIQTATGVEAQQQRTIQFIKDVRDRLEDCMNQLIKALNAFADAYSLAPLGDYEVNYDFGDITYNVEEDRARWWNYVVTGVVPKWKFFVKFEGMTEEEAKEMVEEAQQATLAQMFAQGMGAPNTEVE